MFEQQPQVCKSGNDTNPLRFERTLVFRNRSIAHRTVNQIILLPILGEIFLRVINDLVCPNRVRQIHIPRAAYGGDFSPK